MIPLYGESNWKRKWKMKRKLGETRDLSYNLSISRRGMYCSGFHRGLVYGVIKGDARSLDCNAY